MSDNKSISIEELAGIQYLGHKGDTNSCLSAIVRLVHYGDRINIAKLLTSEEKHHAFILDMNDGEFIAIKSGFASGYIGTGSRGLSTALQVLCKHGIYVDEYDVENILVERLDASCLLLSDLEQLTNAESVRPSCYYDYIDEYAVPPLTMQQSYNKQVVRDLFPAVIPFHIIDDRLLEFALMFHKTPDAAIKDGFRRLETIFSQRIDTGDDVGAKMFSKAFLGEEAPLTWEGIGKGEIVARVQMFTGAFGAYRNPRAHREKSKTQAENLREFLILNELYLLEASAISTEENLCKRRNRGA
jgi:hypothetical protein